MASGNDSSTIFLLQAPDTWVAWEDVSDVLHTLSSSYATHGTSTTGWSPATGAKFGTEFLLTDGINATGEDVPSVVKFTGDDADKLGTGAFTVDMWAMFSSAAISHYVVGAVNLVETAVGSAYGFSVRYVGSATPGSRQLAFKVMYGDVARVYWNPTADTWYHLAFERDASANHYIYVDGVKQTLDYDNSPSSRDMTWSGDKDLQVFDNDSEPIGLEEVRISTGAKYGGTDFTPYTEPYGRLIVIGTGTYDLLTDISASAASLVYGDGVYDLLTPTEGVGYSVAGSAAYNLTVSMLGSGVRESISTGNYDLPISIVGHGGTVQRGTGDYVLNTFDIEAAGYVEPVGVGSYKFPKFQIVGGDGPGGTGSYRMPSFTYAGTGTASLVGIGTYTMPSVQIVGTGIFLQSITGIGAYNMPMVSYYGLAYGTVESMAYERGQGSLTGQEIAPDAVTLLSYARS